MWLCSFYHGKVRGSKLQPKYIGPYTITKALPYQTYEMERNGKKSIQREGRIKVCHILPTHARLMAPREPRPLPPPPVHLMRLPGPLPGEPGSLRLN